MSEEKQERPQLPRSFWEAYINTCFRQWLSKKAAEREGASAGSPPDRGSDVASTSKPAAVDKRSKNTQE